MGDLNSPDIEDEAKPEKLEEKPEPNRWADPGRDDKDEQAKNEQRVVGWSRGLSLTENDVKLNLKQNREQRHAYKLLLKTQKQNQVDKPQKHPLNGLPPTWQAFYATVPHLNPQAAFHQWQREVDKHKKEQKSKAHARVDTAEEETEEAVRQEIRTLEESVGEKRRTLTEKDRVCKDWDRKLAGVRQLDGDDEQSSRNVVRKVEAARYEHGILAGKLRSSDIYFHYLHEDSKKAQEKKVHTLKRSCALIEANIDELKNEIRKQIKQGRPPAEPSLGKEASEQPSLAAPPEG